MWGPDMAPKPPRTFGASRQSRDARLIYMGAPTWPPSPRTFGASRQSRDARLIYMGAPTWPPSPRTFGASRQSRDAPLTTHEREQDGFQPVAEDAAREVRAHVRPAGLAHPPRSGAVGEHAGQ